MSHKDAYEKGWIAGKRDAINQRNREIASVKHEYEVFKDKAYLALAKAIAMRDHGLDWDEIPEEDRERLLEEANFEID